MRRTPFVWWFRDRKGNVKPGRGLDTQDKAVDWSGRPPKGRLRKGRRGASGGRVTRSRWFWIAVAAVVLGLIIWTRDDGTGSRASGGTNGCRVQVTADLLNVRAGPAPTAPVVDKLRSGQVTGAQDVVQNGYRKLGTGQWAATQFLQPAAGSSCR